MDFNIRAYWFSNMLLWWLASWPCVNCDTQPVKVKNLCSEFFLYHILWTKQLDSKVTMYKYFSSKRLQFNIIVTVKHHVSFFIHCHLFCCHTIMVWKDSLILSREKVYVPVCIFVCGVGDVNVCCRAFASTPIFEGPVFDSWHSNQLQYT